MTDIALRTPSTLASVFMASSPAKLLSSSEVNPTAAPVAFS
nr:MAG TPA: hypothetical protein [Bacteriophage sp.]